MADIRHRKKSSFIAVFVIIREELFYVGTGHALFLQQRTTTTNNDNEQQRTTTTNNNNEQQQRTTTTNNNEQQRTTTTNNDNEQQRTTTNNDNEQGMPCSYVESLIESMPHKPQKQYRYKGYDYSRDGFYFVTICCKNREMFFGDVVVGKMQLSAIGKIAEKFWLEIPDHFSFVKLDEYTIMPNHVHGIIAIDNDSHYRRNRACPVPTVMDANKNNCSTFGHVAPKSLSVIIGSFKSTTTRIVNLKFYEIEFTWQPRFHDRIIRNDDELNRIRQYIIDNPEKWELDRNNTENLYM